MCFSQNILEKFDAKFLNILIVTNDFCTENHIFNKLSKFYMNVDIVEDGLEALVLYKRNKYNIVIMDDYLLHLSAKSLVEKIREIKKKQSIVLISNNEFGIKDKNITVLKKQYDSFSLGKTLLELNKNVMERTAVRKEILENRLNLLLKKQDEEFLFSLSINHNYKDNLETWKSICENTIKSNKEFEAFCKTNFTNKEAIKFLSRKLNSYYQIFHFIKEIEVISKFLLNLSILLSGQKDGLNISSVRMKEILEFIFIEIIYFEYVIFFRNEINIIDYFQTCLKNSLNIVRKELQGQ